jgi:membrane fusion protein (multidrug efflux system)
MEAVMTFQSRNIISGKTATPALIIILGIFVLAAAAGCEKETKDHAVKGPAVVVAEVLTSDVPIYKEWVGTTDGFINANIHAKVNGYLMTKNYTEGTAVKEGQLLFTIDDRPYRAALDQAKGNLAQAQANFEKSLLDVNRFTPLAKEGAVSQKELDDAIQQNKNDKANIEANRAAVETAQLNFDWTRVTSPISGIAGIAIAQIGDLVDNSTNLTTVSQIDPIKVVFPISENAYLYFQKWNAEKVKQAKLTKSDIEKEDDNNLELILNDGSTFNHKGELAVADRQINPKTGTIILNGYFPNQEGLLRPGQYAKVKALVHTIRDAVIIPVKAVMEVQSAEMVVTITAENKAEFKPVKLGMMTPDNKSRVVMGGLKAGEKIVVEGLQKVRPGSPVTPMTEEQAKAARPEADSKPTSGK